MDVNGIYYGDNISSPNYRENLIFDWKGYKSPTNGWRYNRAAMERLDKEGLLIYPESYDKRIQYKRYLHHTELWTPSTLFYKDRRAASKSLINLMEGDVFDYPKDVDVLNRLIKIFTSNNDLVLDFFAGSGSTAHAVIQNNYNNEGKIRYILVQIPQPIDENDKKNECALNLCKKLNAPAVISELTKERIRRCENSFSEIPKFGFKVIKLDESNIHQWDSSFDNLEQSLLNAKESIKAERTEEDVLYEILLKYGIELTVPVEQQTVAGKQVYVVGAGALLVCLDDNITTEVVEGIAELKHELDPETTQVVFKDAGFADSVVKTNAIQILKQAGIDDVKSI